VCVLCVVCCVLCVVCCVLCVVCCVLCVVCCVLCVVFVLCLCCVAHKLSNIEWIILWLFLMALALVPPPASRSTELDEIRQKRDK
jgi:hypothetical protein